MDDDIESLREAIGLSPDNLPLRRHLAEALLGRGRAAEAEAEFRQALARWPADVKLKSGLASAFHQQGKHSHAQVIVEELCGQPDAPAKALILFARLLVRAGEIERAVRTYKRAIAADPSAGDAELAERLGIRAPRERDEESTVQALGRGRDDGDEAEVVDGRVRRAQDGEQGSAPEIERPKITFADVGGMDAVKEEIRLKIIYPLTHRDLYKAYGKAIGGGILLYGPPGCGKTHLARATAGEIKAGFIAVGISEVLDMWVGRSERNLHDLFDQARRNRPCVLFFDEVDALAASRADMRQSASRQVINQFLAELDGVQTSNEGVLILAATNAPWHLDPAFKRPGRFDRVLFVPPPDAPARAEILRLLLKDKPVADPDVDQVAKKTDQWSGADLKAVVDVAIERKLQEAMKTGKPSPLTTKDLVAAAATVKPTTKEWFSSAKNHALYANQGGAYDDIVKYLKL